MQKKYPYKKTKIEYLITYFHSKPLTALGMIMLLPGSILLGIYMGIRGVDDEVLSWTGGLWVIFAFVLLAFGQKYEKGRDPERWEYDDKRER